MTDGDDRLFDVEQAKAKLREAGAVLPPIKKGYSVELVERLYEAARALEQAGEGLYIVLVSSSLIERMGGLPATSWSEPVLYRFTEDARHPGVVQIELTTELTKRGGG